MRDQNAVHHHFPGFAYAGVRMSAKDGGHLREFGGHLAIFLMAEMGEQEDGVAVFKSVQVLWQHFLERHEVGAVGVFRVEVGEAVQAELDATDDTDFQAIAFKGFVRLAIGHLQRVVEGDVGAHKGELGPSEHIAQGDGTAVPLVVAKGRQVEADGVHQFIHGLGYLFVAVVDGVARSVVARAE